MDGVIQGGFGFVIASYIIVWGSIFLYALSLLLKLKNVDHKNQILSDKKLDKK